MTDYGFEQRRSGVKSTILPYRSSFETDKGRVIHSEAFRRLQSKTQVLQVSESDFHRNRLTHSVEVAQIGRGISRYIEYKYKDELIKNGLNLDHDLIETICLAHDIGHPPFGHGGEIALNYMMNNHGGFEGNGQTLRIISRLGKYSQGNGMDLTRRACLGVLKYPCSFSKLWNLSKSRQNVDKFYELNQEEWKPPKSCFDDEKEIIDWILQEFTSQDQDIFTQFDISKEDNHKSKYKSFDCSIMDIADDISYSIHDFEDGLELGIFKEHLIEDLIDKIFANAKFKWYLTQAKGYSKEKIERLKSLKDPKWFISVCVGFLINSVEISKKEGSFDCPYLQYNACLIDEAKHVLDEFANIVWENIILSSHSQQLVKNGQIIVCNLFDVFIKNQNLLPENTKEKLQSLNKPHRVICDYVSGMTDRYAIKMYTKIFGSENISFFEK